MESTLNVLHFLNWAASFAAPAAILAMMRKFLERRAGIPRLFLRYAAAWLMFNNIIYFGDYVNILFALPPVFLLVWLGWRCQRAQWLSVSILFYTMVVTLAAITDSRGLLSWLLSQLFCQNVSMMDYRYLERGIALVLAMLVVQRLLPKQYYTISSRIWRLVSLLAALPFLGILASVALTDPYYDKNLTTVLGSGMLPIFVMLPPFFLTVLALLYTATVLANHEQLEQASRLAELREIYYQGVRQQETQVRRLRHDLRNHLTVIRSFLDTGDNRGAIGYLDQIADSPALRGGRRLCENEAANAVLTAKAEAMEREGVKTDFAAALPRELTVADIDLCALLGNALDNALEGTRGAAQRQVAVRCKADKGLLMLRVTNTLGGPVRPDLSTTKADKASHGLGIPGMREIAERYGGTLEAGVREEGFELLVCLPL